jgi:transposase-like protein
MATKKRKIDWESVEKDYRAGTLSVYAVARKHGTKESTIRSRAKTNAWQRDLSAVVKARSKASLSRTASRSDCADNEQKHLTDEEIIREAVATNIAVVTSHIKSIKTLRNITDDLSAILADQVREKMITVDSLHGPIQVSVPIDYVGKGLMSAVTSLERLIKLERQAYSMDVEEQKELEVEDILTEMESEIGR